MEERGERAWIQGLFLLDFKQKYHRTAGIDTHHVNKAAACVGRALILGRAFSRHLQRISQALHVFLAQFIELGGAIIVAETTTISVSKSYNTIAGLIPAAFRRRVGQWPRLDNDLGAGERVVNETHVVDEGQKHPAHHPRIRAVSR